MTRTMCALAAAVALVAAAGCREQSGGEPAEPGARSGGPAEPLAPERADQPGTPAATGGEQGLASCDSYLAAIEKYLACEEVPEQAREATRRSVDTMKEGWSRLDEPDSPPALQEAAAEACRQGEEALRSSAAALGCKI